MTCYCSELTVKFILLPNTLLKDLQNSPSFKLTTDNRMELRKINIEGDQKNHAWRKKREHAMMKINNATVESLYFNNDD